MQSEITLVDQSQELCREDGILVFCGNFDEADDRILTDALLVGYQFDIGRSIPSTLSLFSMIGRSVVGSMRMF